MHANNVMDAIEVMNWLTKQALSMPEQRGPCIAMAAAFAAANVYLVAYAHHVANGADVYDALVKTAGQRPLPAFDLASLPGGDENAMDPER